MRQKRRILMVLDHSFPPDLRVENESRTLVEAGFEVAVLAIGEDNRLLDEYLHGARVIRYRLSNQIRNKMRGLSGSFPFMEWIVGRRIRQIYSEWPFDALHAHDLYLFGTCLREATRLGVRVVGDMHENWVHALSGYYWSTHFPGKAFISLKKWDRLETRWSGKMDALILVIEEMRDRMEKKGIDSGKMIVLPNTIRREDFDRMLAQDASADDAADADKNETRLIYTGGMDRHRGIETVLGAMPGILAEIPQATLVLVGDGASRRDLERRAAYLGIADSVSFEGWQPQELIPGFIRSSDIGLIPHLKSVHTDNTIPHKLFHYMHVGIPVVASDCTPLKRILGSEEAGLIYTSGDSEGLAQAVIFLANNREARAAMGERGKRAVAERYNWEKTAQRLVSVYSRLFADKPY